MIGVHADGHPFTLAGLFSLSAIKKGELTREDRKFCDSDATFLLLFQIKDEKPFLKVLFVFVFIRFDVLLCISVQ